MERAHIDILRSALIVNRKKSLLEQGDKIHKEILGKVFLQLNGWILRSRAEYLITYELLEEGYFLPCQGDTISFDNNSDSLLVTINKQGENIKGNLWYSYVYYKNRLARDHLEGCWRQRNLVDSYSHASHLCDILEHYQLIIDEYFLWRDVLVENSSSSQNLLIHKYQERVKELSQELDYIDQSLISVVQNTQTTTKEIFDLQSLNTKTQESIHLYVDIINLLSTR